VHGVREAEVRERVSEEQVTEIVRDARRGRRVMWQHREPEKDRQQREQQHTEGSSLGEFPGQGRDGHARKKKCDGDGAQSEREKIGCIEPERILR
jgi:hypothetical protein